jgi:hypothetical protein
MMMIGHDPYLMVVEAAAVLKMHTNVVGCEQSIGECLCLETIGCYLFLFRWNKILHASKRPPPP